MEVPKFDSEDDQQGTRCINKIEHYFHIDQIHDDKEKINEALMYLERSVYEWFLWWNSNS